MGPKKKAARHAQIHSQPAPSDFEEDLTDNQLPLPSSAQPQRSAEQLNMLVLRRWYPGIESIEAIAPFATLYLFSPETEQWSKCETEGVLFIVQLMPVTGYPRYKIIILNRRSMENFEYELVSMDNIDITPEFIIIQKTDEDGTLQIYGLWIFSDKSTLPDIREVIAATISDCALKATKYAQHAAELADQPHLDVPNSAYQISPQATFQEIAPTQLHHNTEASLLNTFGTQITIPDLFQKPEGLPAMSSPLHDDGRTQAPGHILPGTSTVNADHSHGPSAQFSLSANNENLHDRNAPQSQPALQTRQTQTRSLLDLFK